MAQRKIMQGKVILTTNTWSSKHAGEYFMSQQDLTVPRAQCTCTSRGRKG